MPVAAAATSAAAVADRLVGRGALLPKKRTELETKSYQTNPSDKFFQFIGFSIRISRNFPCYDQARAEDF